MSSRELKTLKFSTHSMKYIWYSPQKSKYPLCNKIDKPLVDSGLQIFRKRYDVHNNIAYIMTKV